MVLGGLISQSRQIANPVAIDITSKMAISIYIYREYLMSSLPGSAFRTLVDIARPAERFNKRSQSRAWLTGYQKTQTWYSSYQFTHCFTLQSRDFDLIFYIYVDSAQSTTSLKKCNIFMT